MLEQTKRLYEIFDENQRIKLNSIIEQIKFEGEDYKTIDLWKFDQTIGGIGGYCQGCNPARANHFQGTEFRNVYRCLQYVRSHFDILNINDTARYAIEDCGHHLEEAIKLYLKINRKIKWLQVCRYPLGKLIEYISKKHIFEEDVVSKLKLFVGIYNISKHEILSDDELDRTFHADDAIIYYFACRIIGKKILLEIDEERASGVYEINWDKYGRNINRF